MKIRHKNRTDFPCGFSVDMLASQLDMSLSGSICVGTLDMLPLVATRSSTVSFKVFFVKSAELDCFGNVHRLDILCACKVCNGTG